MAPHTVSSPESNKLFESSLATLLWARKLRIAGLCFESFTFLETRSPLRLERDQEEEDIARESKSPGGVIPRKGEGFKSAPSLSLSRALDLTPSNKSSQTVAKTIFRYAT